MIPYYQSFCRILEIKKNMCAASRTFLVSARNTSKSCVICLNKSQLIYFFSWHFVNCKWGKYLWLFILNFLFMTKLRSEMQSCSYFHLQYLSVNLTLDLPTWFLCETHSLMEAMFCNPSNQGKDTALTSRPAANWHLSLSVLSYWPGSCARHTISMGQIFVPSYFEMHLTKTKIQLVQVDF